MLRIEPPLIAPLTPAEAEADSIGSFHAAIEAIGAGVKAGERLVPTTGYFGRSAAE